MRFYLFLSLSFLTLFCRHEPEEALPVIIIPEPESPTEQIDILALGDSYTKGESVPLANNFPNQLVDSLLKDGKTVRRPKIIAQTGWRTDNLQTAIAAQSGEIGDSVFSLVTLCIGVNNQYQNANFETYKLQFEQLLQTAIARAGGRKERVVVLSIPDWAFTPFGQGSVTVSQKIDAYNAANQTITAAYGVSYVNVTEISRRGLAEPNLVAQDGLHPSAVQYTEWLKVLLPVVRTALKE
jgi:lysophospholipase L1-like esterase